MHQARISNFARATSAGRTNDRPPVGGLSRGRATTPKTSFDRQSETPSDLPLAAAALHPGGGGARVCAETPDRATAQDRQMIRNQLTDSIFRAALEGGFDADFFMEWRCYGHGRGSPIGSCRCHRHRASHSSRPTPDSGWCDHGQRPAGSDHPGHHPSHTPARAHAIGDTAAGESSVAALGCASCRHARTCRTDLGPGRGWDHPSRFRLPRFDGCRVGVAGGPMRIRVQPQCDQRLKRGGWPLPVRARDLEPHPVGVEFGLLTGPQRAGGRLALSPGSRRCLVMQIARLR